LKGITQGRYLIKAQNHLIEHAGRLIEDDTGHLIEDGGRPSTIDGIAWTLILLECVAEIESSCAQVESSSAA
jgi:hypothetical protein